jgi:hypothetical protein
VRGTVTFILSKWLGRKRRLKGTGLIISFLKEKQMAKVTYRGVSYDTAAPKATVTKKVAETYRGIQHTETVTVEVAK